MSDRDSHLPARVGLAFALDNANWRDVTVRLVPDTLAMG